MAKDTQVAGKKTVVKKAGNIAPVKGLGEVSKEDLDSAFSPIKDGVKEFKLSDGRTVKIKKAKGYHAEDAREIAGDDQRKYMSALMAMVVTVDGKAIVMEDLREMDARDYLQISGEFSHLNFL